MSKVKIITFRVSEKEYDFITEYIEARKTKMSDFLRSAIFQAIAHGNIKESEKN